MEMVFDLETDGLLDTVTKIHTMCTFDGDKYKRYDMSEVVRGLDELLRADTIIGHNIIGYDLEVIKKLYPSWTYKGTVRDTLVMSRLQYPDIKETDYGLFNKGRLPGKLIGRHKLEAWGYRLGLLKGSYLKEQGGASQVWTPELSEYCEQDVRITVRLYDRLIENQQPDHVIDLEQSVLPIIDRQESHGVLFDTVAAHELHAKLLADRVEPFDEIQKMIPAFYMPAGWVVKRGPEGTIRKPAVFVPKANNRRMHYFAGAPCTKVELTEFNPGSNYHIAWYLKKKYGWEPEEFTPKSGEPKIDESILSSLEYPESALITKLWTIDKRISQLATGNQAWLKSVKADGRIHGRIDTLGAVTRRMSHYSPNMSQVPAIYSPYGPECRALFIAPPGKVLVGIDAAGLEARCLAHYLALHDSGAYAKAVVEGKKEDGTDIHTMTMKALGITSRDDAKTWFYAWLYGAGDLKLSKIIRCPVLEAKRAKKKFLQNLPALAKLKENIELKLKQDGWLPTIDGGRMRCRSAHSALNTLLQSAGAIVMKKALVILDKYIQEGGFIPGVHYEFAINSHDEWQIEVDECSAPGFGLWGVQAIIDAGKALGFRCPLDGEYKIGKNWKETH